MQALIEPVGEVMVVRLVGRLDVETAEPFKRACLKHLIDKKVVFNFKQLSFVGSSGILPFLETMQCFTEASRERFKFCEMSIEFRKVFAASPLGEIEIFDEQSRAVLSLIQPEEVGAAAAVQAAPIGISGAFASADIEESREIQDKQDAGSGTQKDFGWLSLRHVPEETSGERSLEDDMD